MAMMCSALLAARSPPRLRRWRVVLPDEAGTGLTPHSAAKPASDLNCSGLSPAVRRSCAQPACPIELRATRLGASSSTMAFHGVEVGDLVVQLEIAAGQGLE